MTAAFLHFFFLSSFCWVLTEAWQSYLAVIGRIRTRLVRKRFLCLGWGKGAGGRKGGAGTAHPSQYPNPSEGNRGTGGAQTPYPPTPPGALDVVPVPWGAAKRVLLSVPIL